MTEDIDLLVQMCRKQMPYGTNALPQTISRSQTPAYRIIGRFQLGRSFDTELDGYPSVPCANPEIVCRPQDLAAGRHRIHVLGE